MALCVASLCLAGGAFASWKSARAEDLPGEPLAGVELTTQRGTPLESREYRGKTLVLSFFFTRCPSVCPKQAKLLREAYEALAPDVRERVEVVFVSVDPENDTPDALARFAGKHAAGLDAFTFARATEEGTSTLAPRLAVFDPSLPGGAAPGGHTTAIYLFDSRGRLMQRYGGGTEAARLAREIRQIDSMNRSGS